MEERKQKTKESCPREDRLEAEVIEGAQTYMEMTEGRLAEVHIDEKHLMELILSPYNMNRAYRKVVSNGGSGGVDSMEAKDLLPYLKLHNDELRNSILNGKYKPMPVRRVEIPKDNGKTRKLGMPTLVDRGYPFLSYADDSLIFCKSRRGAERVCEGLTKFIEKNST